MNIIQSYKHFRDEGYYTCKIFSYNQDKIRFNFYGKYDIYVNRLMFSTPSEEYFINGFDKVFFSLLIGECYVFQVIPHKILPFQMKFVYNINHRCYLYESDNKRL